jgi:hypothetical protein
MCSYLFTFSGNLTQKTLSEIFPILRKQEDEDEDRSKENKEEKGR